jgi:putative ABC transport system permease protein
MRFADLLRLALSALAQQKMRTALTTFGVVCGTFVLASSLSVGQGVQDAITSAAHMYGHLRRIEVWPIWGGRDRDVPEEVTRVEGEMSEARRELIRNALRDRWAREHGAGPRTPLDGARQREIAALNHVESALPVVDLNGWIRCNDRSAQGHTTAVLPDNRNARSRLVAGRFFDAADEKAAVVSEFLLYRCGLVEEADARRAVGKTLRLEFRDNRPVRGLVLYAVDPDRPRRAPEEDELLAKVLKQLPEAVEEFDLTPQERGLLRRLAGPGPRPAAEDTITADFVIKGVLRLPTAKDRERGRYTADLDADVILPLRTGEELYVRTARGTDYSYGSLTVTVDDEENVREVAAQIQAMGFQYNAPIEFIERERFQYMMIFYSMAGIAGTALLVAALGIANTMLMSVLERTREVGVMKAVGAGDRHIRRMFLVEGGLIGLTGGVLGMVLAWAASFPLDAWIRSTVSQKMKIELKESLFVFPWWITLFCVGVACAVTTAAAVLPAHRAARVNPVAALRHE